MALTDDVALTDNVTLTDDVALIDEVSRSYWTNAVFTFWSGSEEYGFLPLQCLLH